MDCEKARQLLDAYIDGELSAGDMRALEDHAMACEECKRELEAAKLLRDTLADLDEEITVPLKAQAAWRSAVRAEAKRKNMRKWQRIAYAAAAALVLVVGATAAFREVPGQEMLMTADAGSMVKTARIIEADGVEEAAVSADASYTAWKKISVDSPDAAREEIEMLALEYSAACSDAGEGICRIELPYEYMQDFLNAASRIGSEQFSQIMGTEEQTAVILIQIIENEGGN